MFGFERSGGRGSRWLTPCAGITRLEEEGEEEGGGLRELLGIVMMQRRDDVHEYSDRTATYRHPLLIISTLLVMAFFVKGE